MYTLAQLERIKAFLRMQRIGNIIDRIVLYLFITAWIVAIVGLVYVTIKAKLMGI